MPKPLAASRRRLSFALVLPEARIRPPIVRPRSQSEERSSVVLTGSGTTDYIPLWTNASNLASSVIFQGAGHEIGIGTSNPVTPLEVTGNNSISIVDVTQTGSAGGAAVSGDITATSGNGFGVTGSTASPAGTGVVGVNTATTGYAVGTAGSSSSSSGVGVVGVAASLTLAPPSACKGPPQVQLAWALSART